MVEPTTFAVGYRSLFQTTMLPLAASWDELVAALSEHREATRKEAGPCWSPIVPLTDGAHRRCNAAVAAVTALVVDVDDGTPVDDIVARLDGREWIAYSTFSHEPEHPRYHVVVRLDEPVPVDDWPTEYERLHLALGAGDDLPAPSHAYLMPQHRSASDWFVRRSCHQPAQHMSRVL